ncbi:hypothetical protein H5410_025179 [Solanum commersonii]|uniref:Uncharacterized protein n=1 Tax=Solanum commersonii TaxID=4109 RepID=A0A9J5YV86_SOLCO|nr:hypothetical protein H5410_025179 [Solanum commersonii]
MREPIVESGLCFKSSTCPPTLGGWGPRGGLSILVFLGAFRACSPSLVTMSIVEHPELEPVEALRITKRLLQLRLSSATRWFTGLCNSHQVMHFAKFFIDARADCQEWFVFQEQHTSPNTRWMGPDGRAVNFSIPWCFPRLILVASSQFIWHHSKLERYYANQPDIVNGSAETSLKVVTEITNFPRASPKAEVDYNSGV